VRHSGSWALTSRPSRYAPTLGEKGKPTCTSMAQPMHQNAYACKTAWDQDGRVRSSTKLVLFRCGGAESSNSPTRAADFKRSLALDDDRRAGPIS